MKLLVAGAGGHGRVVADAAAAAGCWAEIAFLDDRYPDLRRSGRWDVVGKVSGLAGVAPAFDALVPAIGDAALRIRILDSAMALGIHTPPVLHPRAVIAPDVEIGPGVVVLAGAIINTGARLGRATIVNSGAIVEHDCVLGAGTHVCPGACLAGEVIVGDRCWIGLGAAVRQRVVLAPDVTLGTGAVCVRSLGEAGTYVGVPANRLVRSGHS
jgi:sugar O-acyltransferase (sialic acid O-acetyltransferase NeuD family)